MSLDTKPYKGARDFYPEQMRLRKYMFSKIRTTVESYGYEEYDAPILEPVELYRAKSGDEIVNEQTYTFSDRGGREIAIRPEMTPSVSRMVAGRRQELTYPLRWYSIPNLWRYERPQRGRLREHWQLNVDIFGEQTVNAEVELLKLVSDMYKSFGADSSMFEIRLNSRKLSDYILLEHLSLVQEQASVVSKLIDRINKMSEDSFKSSLSEIITDHNKVKILIDLLKAKDLSDLPAGIKKTPQYQEVDQALKQLKSFNVSNVIYDPTIMRGFDYYTGIVFEVVDRDPENNRAMMGGGRYDGLVGLFGVAPIPVVGFGLGDVSLQNFLESHQLIPEFKSTTDLYLATIGEIDTSIINQVSDQLRASGINLAVDISGKKLGDKFKIADKKSITHVLVIGENEIKSSQYVLKDLMSGGQEQISLDQIIDRIKS